MPASAALRRRRPTLLGLHGPARTRTRTPRVVMGSTQPVWRSTPFGCSSRAPSRRPKPAGGPPWTRAPLQSSSSGPRAVPPVARHDGRRFLSWTPLALRHDPRPVDPYPAADPSAAACRVRGLATPCATSTTSPAHACAQERPWASPFKGSFLVVDRCPSRGPCLPDVARRALASPEGGERNVTAFKALFSRRVRAVAGTTRVPAADPFLGFFLPEPAPVLPGARLSSRRLPSRPQAA